MVNDEPTQSNTTSDLVPIRHSDLVPIRHSDPQTDETTPPEPVPICGHSPGQKTNHYLQMITKRGFFFGGNTISMPG